MNLSDHGFYLLLAYGASGLLLLAEALLLWRRCRRAAALETGDAE
jgi:heme exporter protein CcmD